MNKYFWIFSFLLISACSTDIENQGIELENAKNNSLLVPPIDR